MQKSGFFNAIISSGTYDRVYNSNDYSDNLAAIISNGVVRGIWNELKPTASGMTVTVGTGRAWINGHYYKNDGDETFEVATPTSGSRIDRIMLRMNTNFNARNILLTYVQGEEAAEPTPPEPLRSGDVYDLVIADIVVEATSGTIVINDRRSDKSLCGWVYATAGDGSFFKNLDETFYEWFEAVKDTLSSVTLFKRYNWRTVLETETNTVQFDIPQFDEETCFIEVYVNGILDTEGVEYTRSGNILTGLGLPLVAGTEIEVKCYKSIDGTGIMTVADEITELQNKVAAIEGNARYTYVCKGIDDNINLSVIAEVFRTGLYSPDVLTYPEAVKTFLDNIGDTAYFGSLAEDAQIGIDIVGDLGLSTPYSGSGTAESPYRWFVLGGDEPSARRLLFNFEKCNKINIECAESTTNYIFFGADLHLNSVSIEAKCTAADCTITMLKGLVNTGRITAENCRFVINTTAAAQIAEHCTLSNCYGYIVSENSTAYCFKPKNTGLIRLIGGEFYAYGKTTSGIGSAIMHTSAGDTDGVLLAYNIHCPVVAKTGYSQGFLSVANAGTTYINGVVTRLTSSGDYNDIVGHVNKNKA